MADPISTNDETNPASMNRRRMLLTCGTAGTMAASALYFLDKNKKSTTPIELPHSQAQTARPPHFVPRAKNVIFLFMAGAPSQVDLFDPKPVLKKWADKPFSAEQTKDLKLAFTRPSAKVLPSWKSFKKHGESGTEVSDWLPHISTITDEICLIRSMQTEAFNHHPGQSLLMSGAMNLGRPSMGSWVSYGLGSESESLPAFVVLTSGFQGPEGGTSNWSSGFLPSEHRGVAFQSKGTPIPYLSNPPGISNRMQHTTLAALQGLNAERFTTTGDREIVSRMASYELAFQMQASAPELMDVSAEPKHMQESYGLLDPATAKYGKHCLLARRMVERGVRFVMLADASWDGHTFLDDNHTKRCKETDQPVATLIKDLKQRGLLEDTLVVWGGEFGRTPMAERSKAGVKNSVGRDHHSNGFSMWLAGGGIKGGQVIGTTDELGLGVAERPVHLHDLQATILHCLGLNHEMLTHRHMGRDFRLTDVAGTLIPEALA
jgi:hypothetical protein